MPLPALFTLGGVAVYEGSGLVLGVRKAVLRSLRLGVVWVGMKGSNVRKSEDDVSSPYPTPSKENTER
jgi:hypothetical protein